MTSPGFSTPEYVSDTAVRSLQQERVPLIGHELYDELGGRSSATDALHLEDEHAFVGRRPDVPDTHGKGPGLRWRLRRLVQQDLTTLWVETKKQRALPGEESHVTGAVVERDGPNPLSAQAVVELLGQRRCQE